MAELAEEATEVTNGGIESLSDLFNDDEVVETTEQNTPEVETTETEKVEPEKADEKPEAEEPRDDPKVETTATEQESGQMAALIAERRKRQEAENKLKEYEAKKAVPDPIDDPEGYANHVKLDNQSAMLQTKITLSRDLMIDNTTDYAEKEAVFIGLVVDQDGKITNQSLLQQFQESANPARFAYQHAKEHLEVQQLKDPKYRENLEAELRLKILKELEADASKSETLTAAQVPDLTTATASAKNSEVIEIDGDNPADLFDEGEL